MRREYSPYSPPPEPEAQGKKPLPWSHMIISGAVGIVIGVVIMVAASMAINAWNEAKKEKQAEEITTAEISAEILSNEGIDLSPEEFEEISTFVCEGLDSGDSANLLAMVLTEMPGISMSDADSIVDMSVMFDCTEHILVLDR